MLQVWMNTLPVSSIRSKLVSPSVQTHSGEVASNTATCSDWVQLSSECLMFWILMFVVIARLKHGAEMLLVDLPRVAAQSLGASGRVWMITAIAIALA